MKVMPSIPNRVRSSLNISGVAPPDLRRQIFAPNVSLMYNAVSGPTTKSLHRFLSPGSSQRNLPAPVLRSKPRNALRGPLPGGGGVDLAGPERIGQGVCQHAEEETGAICADVNKHFGVARAFLGAVDYRAPHAAEDKVAIGCNRDALWLRLLRYRDSDGIGDRREQRAQAGGIHELADHHGVLFWVRMSACKIHVRRLRTGSTSSWP